MFNYKLALAAVAAIAFVAPATAGDFTYLGSVAIPYSGTYTNLTSMQHMVISNGYVYYGGITGSTGGAVYRAPINGITTIASANVQRIAAVEQGVEPADWTSGSLSGYFPMAVDGSGNVYIGTYCTTAGNPLNRIAKYNSNGILDTSWGTNGYYLNGGARQESIAAFKDGRLFVEGGRGSAGAVTAILSADGKTISSNISGISVYGRDAVVNDANDVIYQFVNYNGIRKYKTTDNWASTGVTVYTADSLASPARGGLAYAKFNDEEIVAMAIGSASAGKVNIYNAVTDTLIQEITSANSVSYSDCFIVNDTANKTQYLYACSGTTGTNKTRTIDVYIRTEVPVTLSGFELE